jgi:methylglutamate dehydrogenase subunit A
MAGADAVLLDSEGVRNMCPYLDFDNARFPIKGGLWQKRGGTARHDAVVWGYARGADSRGVDILQNCEVTGFVMENGVCKGVETTRGTIRAGKVGVSVAGSSGKVMAQAGMRLPIESHVLQAFVSEGLKPIIPGVITYGAGHFYISQSDKGGLVFGGDIDGYNSFMDMSMDGSPFIDKTSIDGLYFNGGWCYGGFKATPASGYCFAHLLATDTPHPTATAYRLDRFRQGAMIDEKGAGAQPNLH